VALVERLMGIDPDRPKIPVHGFEAVLGEWADGTLTNAQAQAAIDAISGEPLSADEVTEATAIKNTVTNIPVPAAPTGTVNATFANTQALRAQGMAQRNRRAHKIGQILLLVDARAPGYDTPALVRAKLGI
jgi:hypothetical protein